MHAPDRSGRGRSIHFNYGWLDGTGRMTGPVDYQLSLSLSLSHTHTHTQTHARTHTHTHIHRHARTHTYTHTDTQTHRHTHTHIASLTRERRGLATTSHDGTLPHGQTHTSAIHSHMNTSQLIHVDPVVITRQPRLHCRSSY